MLYSVREIVRDISRIYLSSHNQGSHASWKVLEKHFGPGKSWKLKLKVLESPGKIFLKITHFLLVLMENKQK